MKQDFQFQMNRVSVNVASLKVYVIQSNNEIMMDVGESVRNQMIGVLVKMTVYGILVIVSVI